MPEYSDFTKKTQAEVPAVSAAATLRTPIWEAPVAGKLTGASYTPSASVTGANTDTRTISIVNRTSAGAGSTSMASLALASGVNMTSGDEKALTLSGTAANLVFAAGDVLAFESVHAGNGLADPGGLVQIEYQEALG